MPWDSVCLPRLMIPKVYSQELVSEVTFFFTAFPSVEFLQRDSVQGGGGGGGLCVFLLDAAERAGDVLQSCNVKSLSRGHRRLVGCACHLLEDTRQEGSEGDILPAGDST